MNANDGNIQSIYSEPLIRYVHQVLDEIHRGEVVFPRFQRPLVWEAPRRIALLDSLVEGIPIGAIMEWRSTKRDLAIKDHLGPFLLPPESTSQPFRRYVLDGEQRMSTLYFALYDVPSVATPRDEEGTEAFKVFYDLHARGFVASSEVDTPRPTLLPLRALFNSRAFNQFLRVLPPDALGAGLDVLAERVQEAFKTYKLPVMPIVTDDFQQAERTFERINSQNVAMGQAHMIHALSWSPTFDLIEELDAIRQEHLAPLGWESIDDKILIQLCDVVNGVEDPSAEDARTTAERLRRSPEALRAAGALLANVATFFAEHCGICHCDLVPYEAHVSLLAQALWHSPERDEEADRRLRDWIWLTTYTEEAGSVRGHNLRRLREEVRSLTSARVPRTTWTMNRKRLPRFDPRRGRSRRVMVMFAEQLSAARGGNLDPFALIGRARSEAIGYLTPHFSGECSGLSATRCLGDRQTVKDLRDSLARGDLSASDAKAQLIPLEAIADYRRRDYNTFVKRREDLLNKLEEDHFNRVLRSVYL